MARPKSDHPTPGELEVLKILWEKGPSTVREIMNALKIRGKNRAYTTVMSRMNMMTDKRLLTRKPQGRAFVYQAKTGQEKTSKGIVGDLLKRVFNGNAEALVSQLLEQADPSSKELEEIHKTIKAYRKRKGTN